MVSRRSWRFWHLRNLAIYGFVLCAFIYSWATMDELYPFSPFTMFLHVRNKSHLVRRIFVITRDGRRFLLGQMGDYDYGFVLHYLSSGRAWRAGSGLKNASEQLERFVRKCIGAGPCAISAYGGEPAVPIEAVAALEVNEITFHKEGDRPMEYRSRVVARVNL